MNSKTQLITYMNKFVNIPKSITIAITMDLNKKKDKKNGWSSKRLVLNYAFFENGKRYILST